MPIDSDVLALIGELDELRHTREDHWQIPRAEGDVLFQLALASGATQIIEFGTSYGFSGLFWGAALKLTGGTLHTIDIDARKYESSKDTFRRAGLKDVVVNHLGDAAQVSATIPGPFDIAFIDAFDKKASRQYFEMLWPRIRPGGSVLVDNAVTHRQELSQYVSYVRSRADATSAEIPVGNGFEWTLKLG